MKSLCEQIDSPFDLGDIVGSNLSGADRRWKVIEVGLGTLILDGITAHTSNNETLSFEDARKCLFKA